MRKASRIALDTEADSLHHYYEKVCLIQLSMGGEHVVVDPLSDIDLGGFLSLLARKPLILHGADYDLRILRASYGFRPDRPVFDTMIAAQLLGYEKVGLAALVDHFVGISLSKAGQREDWSKRPLTPTQLEYASHDTRYLETLAEKLEEELRARGRVEWHNESCEALVKATGKDKPPPDPEEAWRIKGLKDLNRRQLAFVRELWRWRETEAQAADLPPFKIVRNQYMLKLALWASSHSKTPLEKGPSLPLHLMGRRLRELKKAVHRARALPKPKWPKPRERRNYSRVTGFVIDALREENGRRAAELGIDPGVLASRACLENIVRARAVTREEIMKAGPLLGWQAEQLEDGVRKILRHDASSEGSPGGA